MTMDLIILGSVNTFICEIDQGLYRALMEHYGFTAESIPPRIIARETIATRVRLSSLMADLARELGTDSVMMQLGNGDNIMVQLAADGLTEPDEAYTLPDAEIDKIVRG